MNINYTKWDVKRLAELVNLWNQELVETFPMSIELFKQNSFEDENICYDGSLIATTEDGRIVGFIVAKKWQEKLTVNMSADTGWIQVLLVDKAYRNQGIGTELLSHAERVLKTSGMKKVLLGRDPWHYFPGIPGELEDVSQWFEKKGYTTFGTEFDLINHYDKHKEDLIQLDHDLSFSILTLKDKDAFLMFLRRCFPGRWEYEAIHYFKKGGTGREFVILKKVNEIIGFSRINDGQSPLIAQNVYWSPLFNEELGGIGPLGIDSNERKQGYGLAIVEAAISFLRDRDINIIVIDWTGLVNFYKKLGYETWKEYNSYQKEFIE